MRTCGLWDSPNDLREKILILYPYYGYKKITRTLYVKSVLKTDFGFYGYNVLDDDSDF